MRRTWHCKDQRTATALKSLHGKRPAKQATLTLNVLWLSVIITEGLEAVESSALFLAELAETCSVESWMVGDAPGLLAEFADPAGLGVVFELVCRS